MEYFFFNMFIIHSHKHKIKSTLAVWIIASRGLLFAFGSMYRSNLRLLNLKEDCWAVFEFFLNIYLFDTRQRCWDALLYIVYLLVFACYLKIVRYWQFIIASYLETKMPQN